MRLFVNKCDCFQKTDGQQTKSELQLIRSARHQTRPSLYLDAVTDPQVGLSGMTNRKTERGINNNRW